MLGVPGYRGQLLASRLVVRPLASHFQFRRHYSQSDDKKEKSRLQSIKERVKHEMAHYWSGSKLLAKEARISSSLLWRLIHGESLTRREQRQLKRTSGDLFRLVPFAVMLIVPFLELLIPVVIKIFPNFLPSTFEHKTMEEEKRRRLLKVRLEMAKFLRETLSEAAKMKQKNIQAAEEFTKFFKKVILCVNGR